MLIGGFDQCGSSDTSISSMYGWGHHSEEFKLRTPYDDSGWPLMYVAWVPDRVVIRVEPEIPSLMLPVTQPSGDLVLRIDNRICWSQGWGTPGWALKTEVPWLSPKVITATTVTGTALLVVNAAGMDTGFYTGTITILSAPYPEFPYSAYEMRTVTVNLWLVDEVHKSYLPVVLH